LSGWTAALRAAAGTQPTPARHRGNRQQQQQQQQQHKKKRRQKKSDSNHTSQTVLALAFDVWAVSVLLVWLEILLTVQLLQLGSQFASKATQLALVSCSIFISKAQHELPYKCVTTHLTNHPPPTHTHTTTRTESRWRKNRR
jgi:hypothetical protein